MTRWRVAVLGAGIGEKHLDAYARLPDRFEVAVVCDLNEGLANRLAARVGARATVSMDEVLADPTVAVVDICLPPSLHVPVALRVLDAGKHAILEKPVAGSLHDADRLAAAEAAAPGRVFPVFQYRYGRAMAALGRLRAAGFGARPLVASLETHWDRGAAYYAVPWRGTWQHELGGAVLSHAIHSHDLLIRAFGPVAEVSAMLTTRANPIETEDCAAISFRLENGAVASSSITLGAAGDTSRLRFVYDDLTAESARLPYTPAEADWTFRARDPARQAEVDAAVAATDCPHEGFAGFCAAVADTLDGRAGPAVSLADGIASIELAAAIYHADRTRRQVLLPLDRGLPVCAGFRP